MKGLFVTFIIYVILVDIMFSLSESDSCEGEHCDSVISLPIMDNMKASLKADLDVSKLNKHLKAYIKQEIKKGVKMAMESMMKQMIENKTEKMNSEITDKFKDAEERHTVKTDQMELLIKNKSEEMLTLFQDNVENQTIKTVQMEQVIKNKSEEMLTLFQDNVENQTIKTVQMEQVIKNKSEEMLTLIKDNEDKSMASFDVKMEEFKQKFEQKDRLKYAFFAYLSSYKSNLKIGTIVIFDVVPLNIVSAYDGTTGKFTCKEDGIYTFSWTTLSNSNSDFTSALVVDGTPIASNAVDNDVTGDALTGSNTVIVEMTTGQQAWIKVLEPAKNFLRRSWSGGIPNTVFSGFKI